MNHAGTVPSHVLVCTYRWAWHLTWPACHAALAEHVVLSRALLWALPRAACHATSRRWPALQSPAPACWPCSACQVKAAQGEVCCAPSGATRTSMSHFWFTLQSPPPACEPSMTSECACGAFQPGFGWKAPLWPFPGTPLPLVSTVSKAAPADLQATPEWWHGPAPAAAGQGQKESGPRGRAEASPAGGCPHAAVAAAPRPNHRWAVHTHRPVPCRVPHASWWPALVR